ncbi:MAG: exodeoxyribonuclease VII large subunit [Candidatus Omnitrophica bacterium]|nr:exodeoxyribonuclease VII large subunit [Candidatus Omnitrophota bacterium]
MELPELSEDFLTTPKRKVYTVSQLNREARFLLESQFASIWIEAEISNFKRHSSGHFYFTLKDSQSQISAVFFSRQNQYLKFEPKDGLQVLAMGRISLYEARGQYQFYIERLEPKGMGSLQLAFLQLKEKLEKEGLFRPEHKKPIPRFPRVVGVVTSPTGAAIRDILNVVNRRFQGTRVLLNPVRVQGDGAAAEIAKAIEQMNLLPEIDVLIVGRGGGSLEDLWAFNEEIVARAVYRSKIPIISAVGHEIDWTICDLVADLRAPTPSAAAELVVQNREELCSRMVEYQSRMRSAISGLLETNKERLEALEQSYAFKQPAQLIEQYAQRLDELFRQLLNYSKTVLGHKKHLLQNLAGKLHALSPLAILERGYSLTFKEDGKLLKDLQHVKIGNSITTKLRKGILHSKVTKIIEVKE